MFLQVIGKLKWFCLPSHSPSPSPLIMMVMIENASQPNGELFMATDSLASLVLRANELKSLDIEH